MRKGLSTCLDLTLAFCLGHHALAECPAANQDPIMYDTDHFLCAQYWDGAGDDLAINACYDCEANHSGGKSLS